MGDRFESYGWPDVTKDHLGPEGIDPAATDDCIGTGGAYPAISCRGDEDMNEQDKFHLDSLLNKFEQMLAKTTEATKQSGWTGASERDVLN